MKFKVLNKGFQLLLISMYILTVLLFVPSPQTENFNIQNKSKNIDNIVHILFTDILDVEQELEPFNFSLIDDAIDIVDIHNHLHFQAPSIITEKHESSQIAIKWVIGDITKYYESFNPDLNTPPPRC